MPSDGGHVAGGNFPLQAQACACIASLQQVPQSFGNYTGLLTQPCVMQFALRYEF